MMTAAGEHYKRLLKERLGGLQPYPSDHFSGTGILICAGGPSFFTNAYVLVRLLRVTHGCTLPIEVWHFGRGEMSARMKLLLRDLGVDTVDAEAVLTALPARIQNGWQLKAYALIWSRFEHVLMLDADQVPLRDPAELFEWDEYRQTGAVLWPDCGDILETNPIWDACELKPRTCPAVESGQLLIHKARHWRALQITLHFNEHSAYYYQLVYGDKDTFLLGLLLAETGYALVPHRPFSDAPFCLFQRNMAGEVLFQHRTGAKWRYAGPQLKLPKVELEQECLGALATLRAQWNGLVFTPPMRSLRAREAEAGVAAARLFQLRRPGEEPARLELLPESEIGEGRTAATMNWHCEEIESAIELVISDAFCAAWRLRREANGWSGSAVNGSSEVYLAEQRPYLASARDDVRSLTEEILSAAGFPNPIWRRRRAEISAALGLIAALEPGIGDALAVISARCGNSEKQMLDAIASELRREPRNDDFSADRANWPMPGRYSIAADL
jgi:Mannosyltransferase putative